LAEQKFPLLREFLFCPLPARDRSGATAPRAYFYGTPQKLNVKGNLMIFSCFRDRISIDAEEAYIPAFAGMTKEKNHNNNFKYKKQPREGLFLFADPKVTSDRTN
jgi:hypothetical protein